LSTNSNHKLGSPGNRDYILAWFNVPNLQNLCVVGNLHYFTSRVSTYTELYMFIYARYYYLT
jgi:hypothetical protein